MPRVKGGRHDQVANIGLKMREEQYNQPYVPENTSDSFTIDDMVVLLNDRTFLEKYGTQFDLMIQYKFVIYTNALDESQEGTLANEVLKGRHAKAQLINELVSSGTSKESAQETANLRFGDLEINSTVLSKYKSIRDIAVAKRNSIMQMRQEGTYIEFIHMRLSETIKAIKDIKGVTRKEIRNKLCDMIVLMAESYDSFRDNYMNFVLMGHAGIGKTTTAVQMAKVFKAMGLLLVGDFKQTEPSNFIAGYVGHTSIKTAGILAESLENVLFIDEAYGLVSCDVNSGTLTKDTNNFGAEAITGIVNFLSRFRGQSVAIVAGYEKAIRGCFLKSNEGLDRRFPEKILLPDFTAEDLTDLYWSGIVKSSVSTHMLRSIGKTNLSDDDPIVVWYNNVLFDIISVTKELGYLKNQAGDIENLVTKFLKKLIVLSTRGQIRDDILNIARLMYNVFDEYLAEQGQRPLVKLVRLFNSDNEVLDLDTNRIIRLPQVGTPKASSAPNAPNAPKASSAPDAPNASSAPNAPNASSAPNAPKASSAPSAPNASSAPSAPKASSASGASKASKASSAPNASSASSASNSLEYPGANCPTSEIMDVSQIKVYQKEYLQYLSEPPLEVVDEIYNSPTGTKVLIFSNAASLKKSGYSTPIRVVTVKLLTSDANELHVMKNLPAILCNIISAKIITIMYDSVSYRAIVMNKMYGNIGILRPVKAYSALGIAKIMLDTAICLVRNGYVYTDYKPENILFQCEGNRIYITYGDLGGLYPIAELSRMRSATATYFLKERPSEKSMVWGIAITYLLLFRDNTVQANRDWYDIYEDSLSSLQMSDRDRSNALGQGLLWELVNKGVMTNNQAKLFNEMISLDPAARPTLQEAYSRI